MSKEGRPHPLDRPVARLVAVAVALTAAGALAAIHRDDLAGLLAGTAAVPEDPLSRCVAGQHATIDQGVADGAFRREQATLFKQRAEALCRSTVPQ